MGLWSHLKTWFILQLLVGYVFISSGLIASFLCLLAYIFVYPFNKTIYRKIVCNLAYSFWSQFTFLGQWWSGSDCTLHMDHPEDVKYIGQEHAIVMMNHKYDIDWMMGWILSERLSMLGQTKIYGKKSLRLVPLIGWIWTFTESIFLRREWEKDKLTLQRDLKYVGEYPPSYWVSLLLFCEGTRFTEEKRVASMEIARKKGLPELKHHLLPRTKGFVLSVNGVKGTVTAILDLTVAFRSDGAPPTFMSLVQGKACKAEMFVRRIPITEVPTDTDENCALWLHQHYKNKDDIYDNFVQNGCFTRGTKVEIPRRPHDLLMFIFWATLLWIPLFYYLTNLFIAGSLTSQLGLVVFVAIMSLIVRKMIHVTVTERGSKYGDEDAKKK